MDNIRAIRNDDDLVWAIAEITPYFENEPEIGTPEAERFDVLGALIETYEVRYYPIDPPSDPIDYVRMFMNETGRGKATWRPCLVQRPVHQKFLRKNGR